MRGLSRREFLGGTAGLTAAAVLGPSQRPASAATTPLAGATVDQASYGAGNIVKDADIFDGYVGMPMARTLQKIYLSPRVFPTAPSSKMTQLAAVGCQFLVSIKPTKTMAPFEQHRLQQWLAMMKNAGLSFRVILFSEANDRAFLNQAEWLTYWQFYAPTIQAAGIPCCYDPGCNPSAITRAQEYFPSSPAPDELWMDYYATSFRGGARIDELISQARAAGISAGLAEWGWHAGPSLLNPMSMPWWNYYCNYLVHLAGQGNLALGTVYFDAAVGLRENVIATADDPRIPGIQNVAKAVQLA